MHFTIVAGEASGDLLGGPLVHSILEFDAKHQIDGIGGEQMRAAGMDTLFDIEETAVMGLTEIIRHYPRLKKILNTLKLHLLSSRPDLLILIDYPEFNFRLAKFASQLGIPVMFYVSPQVWAWRKKRVHKMKKWIQLMAVLFPFELKFYQDHGIPCCLAKHPLAEKIQTQAKSPRKIDFTTDVRIALLPGSRLSEIQRILPSLLLTAKNLKEKYPNATFFIPVASSSARKLITDLCKTDAAYINLQSNQLDQACSACDIALVTSGTATLNIAMLGVPMIIVYKISPLTYRLLKPFVRLKNFGLANIVLGEEIYPELLQQKASAESITKEAISLLACIQSREIQYAKGLSIQKKLNAGLNAGQLAEKAIQLAASETEKT